MLRNLKGFDSKVCLLLVTVVLVPGVARAVSLETREERNELQTAAGIKAQARPGVSSPQVYKKPQLPAHVLPAEHPAMMPQNEKIRIVPLDTIQVPAAIVLAQPVQPSIFKTAPAVQPAAAPTAQALAVKPVVDQPKKS